jgi:hypothetical protein
MIQRSSAEFGIKTQVGNPTFRAKGITAYLAKGGALEHAHHQGLRSHERAARSHAFLDTPVHLRPNRSFLDAANGRAFGNTHLGVS